MIYVMGGPQGNHEKYVEMLNKLKLDDEKDALFVLGNVIGDTADSIEILKDMMYRQNIFPVLGSNEFFAKTVLPELTQAKTLEDCAKCISAENKGMLASWVERGGYKMIAQFLSLDGEGRESIIDYLNEFAPYEEVDAGGRTFVLTHSGIRNFQPEKELDDYSEADFVFDRADFSKIYFKDRFLVTAGEPTKNIPGGKDGKVFSAKRHLAVLCCEDASERLAAVCLDTLKVSYC